MGYPAGRGLDCCALARFVADQSGPPWRACAGSHFTARRAARIMSAPRARPPAMNSRNRGVRVKRRVKKTVSGLWKRPKRHGRSGICRRPPGTDRTTPRNRGNKGGGTHITRPEPIEQPRGTEITRLRAPTELIQQPLQWLARVAHNNMARQGMPTPFYEPG